MSHVRLRCHQELKRNILRSQRVCQSPVWLVEWRDFGTELAGRFLDVLRGDIFWRGLFWDGVGCEVDEGGLCWGSLGGDCAEGGWICAAC